MPSDEKKKSVNAVSGSVESEKISTEIQELKDLVFGRNEKIHELEQKAEMTSTAQSQNKMLCRACREPGHFAQNCPHKEGGNRAPEIPIRYCKVTHSVCPIFVCDDIKVQPGTEQVIEAKLENGFERNTGTPGILEDSRELTGKSEVNIAHSLVIPRDGLTLVQVANYSDRPIRLRADLPVAEYYPVSSGGWPCCSVETRSGFNKCLSPTLFSY